MADAVLVAHVDLLQRLLFRTQRLHQNVERLGEAEVDGRQVVHDPAGVVLDLRVQA